MPSEAPPSGVVLVDKPKGITSHDVVSRVRRAAGTRKVGHAGTLDPMATGLLLLGIESSTRLLTYLVGLDKEYLATIRLGVSTDTDDAEGATTATVDASGVTREAVLDGIRPLTGPIEQVPSTYSAIKVDGRRAYDLARSGEQVELKSRAVTVSAFEVLDVRQVPAEGEGADRERAEGGSADGDAARPAGLDVDVRVECSSGTYIRALARDLGAALGVGGHLTALRRTRIGDFRVEDAVEPAEGVLDSLRSPAAVAGSLFPTHALDPEQLVDLTHGKAVQLPVPDADILAALTPDGRLAGLVRVRGGRTRVLLNLPTAEVLA